MNYDKAALNQAVGVAGCAGTPAPTSPLDRLGVLADRVEHLGYIAQTFVERFYGGDSQDGNSKIAPVPSGYMGQLERLSAAVDALDNTLQSIQRIG